ncbi:MAG: hypothetical protein ACTIA6_08520 [Pseudoclavibacter sp.]
MRANAGLLAVAVVAALTLSACSGGQATQGSDVGFPDATMVIDHEQGAFIYPISAYVMSPEDGAIVGQADLARFNACLVSQGGTAESGADESPSVRMADRRYGLWDIEEASVFGYDFPYDLSQPSPTSEEFFSDGTSGQAPEQDTVQNRAYESCTESTTMLPSVIVGALPSDDQPAELYLANSIRRTAYDLAKVDPAWAVADDEWYACLEDAGLVVDRSAPENFGPVKPADTEGALRTAVAEATCSQETDRVQRLGDIEARYQATLIDEQQAALNTSVEEQQRIVEEAKAIIRESS